MTNIFLILSGIFLALLLRVGYIASLPKPSFTPKPDTTLLAPPTHALKGTVMTLTGEVKKLARNAEDFTPLDSTQPILEGEVIATGNAARITLSFNGGIIILHPNTELEFSNGVYPSLLFRLRSGTVDVTHVDAHDPLYIRALHTINKLYGDTTFAIEESTLTVTAKTGSVQLGMIDANNETHVQEIKEGQKAIIDDNEKTVKIKK